MSYIIDHLVWFGSIYQFRWGDCGSPLWILPCFYQQHQLCVGKEILWVQGSSVDKSRTYSDFPCPIPCFWLLIWLYLCILWVYLLHLGIFDQVRYFVKFSLSRRCCSICNIETSNVDENSVNTQLPWTIEVVVTPWFHNCDEWRCNSESIVTSKGCEGKSDVCLEERFSIVLVSILSREIKFFLERINSRTPPNWFLTHT